MKVIRIVILLIVLCAAAAARDWAVRFVVGPFSPQDWSVKGISRETKYFYDFDNSWPNDLGFGNGFEYLLSIEKRIGKTGIRLETGARTHRNSGEYLVFWGGRQYSSRLTVLWTNLDLLCRNYGGSSRFSPFIGFGPGIYVIDRIQKTNFSPISPWVVRQDARDPVFGVHFFGGLDYTIFSSFFLGSEFDYSYLESDFKLKDDDGSIIKLNNLNLGGTSIRIGLGYRF